MNVYERWETDEALERFRGSGPDEGIGGRILGAEVLKYRVSAVADP